MADAVTNETKITETTTSVKESVTGCSECKTLDHAIVILKRLDSHAETQGRKLDTIGIGVHEHKSILESALTFLKHNSDTQSKYMHDIADGTREVAAAIKSFPIALESYRKDNQDLVHIISDKKSIPFSLVFFIIAIVTVVFIIAVAAIGHVNISLDAENVSVSQGDSVQTNKNTKDIEKLNSTSENK